MEENNISEQYRPLTPWEYWGYGMLYSVPVIGIIMLIINSFDDSNINRKNFTRSFWCGYILVAIILAIVAAIIGLSYYTESLWFK